MVEAKRPDENEKDGKDEKNEPEGGRPGPTDQGREGGMATREVGPEIITADDAQEPPD